MTTPDRPADVTALRDALLVAWHANAEPSDAASWFADDLAAFEAAVRADATNARLSRNCRCRALWWSRSLSEGWLSMTPLLAALQRVGQQAGRPALDVAKGVAW